MHFTNETKRNYVFRSDFEINHMGIKSDCGFIRFPKSCYDNRDKLKFKNINECFEWVDKNMDKFKKIQKTLNDIKFKSAAISESEWETIQKFLLTPENFKAEDFRTYDSWLAHNAKDRDNERFTVGVLKSFVKSIVGKGVFMEHPSRVGGLPEGTFYSAELKEVSDGEMIEYLGANPDKNLAKQLGKIREIDGGLYWLFVKMYMLADNENIRRLDAGIIKDMSISFNAPAIRDTQDENGKTMWREYINTDEREADAYEGSFVFLGSQYGAGTKDADNDNKEDKAVWSTAEINTFEDNCFAVVEAGTKDDEGKTIPRSARHLPHHAKGNGAAGAGGTVDLPHLRNALARVNQIEPVTDTNKAELISKARAHLQAHAKKLGIGSQEEGINMEFTIKVFGQEIKVAEESDVVKLTELIETKTSEIMAVADNTVKQIKETFGTDNFDALKQIAADAKGYKDSLVADVLKWGTLCKVITDANIEEKKSFLGKCDVAVLKQFAEEYKKIHDDRNPPPAHIDEPAKKEIKPEVKLIY